VPTRRGTRPTISQHLKVLREAGLVQTRRRGTQICYSIDPGYLADLQATLADLRHRLATATPAAPPASPDQ
jgi:ArsR family transcriptional regulator